MLALSTPSKVFLLRRLCVLGILGFFVSITPSGLSAQADYQAAYPQSSAAPQGDPPSRVARLSLLQGNVSLQPASVQDFSPAELNYPLTSGDRVWADAGSLAELQIDQMAIRLGQTTDFTVTGLTDTLAQFGLASGSVHLRTFALDPGSTTELDTPSAAVTVLAPGDLRVDVDPEANSTVVTLLSGAVQVDAPGLQQQLRPGESLQLTGNSPVYAQDVRRPRSDGLDSFSSGRDAGYESALAANGDFVDPGTEGAADLGTYGDWSPDPEYGPVWYPRAVPAGWQPYRYGHWAWVAPWGWTWVESEPWGFAPFHYGRWNNFGGRWGWVPGPPRIRPIYSPALVAFVGGPEFSVRLGFGAAPGAGVTAWFPLGPREVYQPWYHASDVYVTRVNVTNIYNRNTVEVRNIYAGRAPAPFASALRPDAPPPTYVNRSLATVAMPQAAFASGRSVTNSALRVAPNQFADAPVLPHPLVSPTHAIVTPAPAHALPPQIARPVLRTEMQGQYQDRQPPTGFRASPGSPNGPPSFPPRPSSVAPGTTAGASTAPGAPTTPGNAPQRAPAPVVRGSQSVPPITVPPAPARPFPVISSPSAPTPAVTAPESPATTSGRSSNGGRQAEPPQAVPAATPLRSAEPNAGAPPDRSLFNRAQPPAPRPSFEQQRDAMQQTDPGRPLSPQQLNNLRNSQPAGPPAQREFAPHPAPAAPPSRPSPQPAPNRAPAPPATKPR